MDRVEIPKKIWRGQLAEKVISVSCHSLTGERNPNGFDGEAVQFLLNWGFRKPDERVIGDWRLFERAVAEIPGHVFLVKHAAPNYEFPYISFNIQNRIRKGRPGYFLLSRLCLATRHEVLVDYGHAQDFEPDRPFGAHHFIGYGVGLASWDIHCAPQGEIEG